MTELEVRLDHVEQTLERLAELTIVVAEPQKQLAGHQMQLLEHQKEMLENQRDLTDQVRTLIEHQRILAEVEKQSVEHQEMFENETRERLKAIEDRQQYLDQTLGTVMTMMDEWIRQRSESK